MDSAPADELERIRARLRAELEDRMRRRPATPVGVQEADAAGLDDLLGRVDVAFVDLWAPWCGPCRAFAPVFEAVAREQAGKAAFVKVNVDDEPAVADRYQVQGIPTLLVVRDGRVVARHAGALPPQALRTLVGQHL